MSSTKNSPEVGEPLSTRQSQSTSVQTHQNAPKKRRLRGPKDDRIKALRKLERKRNRRCNSSESNTRVPVRRPAPAPVKTPLDSTTAMGNDGGSIPDRRDLVKSKAKAEQVDKANQILARWFSCALSKRPLEEPIVSCALGKLYNKDAILEYLIDKTAYGDGEAICRHIRSLKDVVTLKLTPNPAPVVPERSRAAYVCPLTLKEMTGALPFVYLSTCGCVLSVSGLRALTTPAPDTTSTTHGEESKHTRTLCPQCSKPYEKETDVLTINPSDEEEEFMRAAMEAKRAAAKNQNGKGKKRKAVEMEKAKGESAVNGRDSKRQKTSIAPAAPKTNAAVAAMARKVAESLAEEELKRKTVMSDAVASLYTAKGTVNQKKETFTTMGTFTRYA